MFLQLPAGRADRFQEQRHVRLFGVRPPFFRLQGEQAVTTFLPRRALRARDDMVEREVTPVAAILALEPVAQEKVEPREGGEL